jgi:ankyrin repeat protein
MGLLRTAIIGVAALALSAGAAMAGPLHDAARAEDSALVLKLLEDGADVNEQDESGETPLMHAALVDRLPGHLVLDLLLRRGADATIRNDRGMTVLHAAAMTGHVVAVPYFLGEGPVGPDARIDINDHDNKFGVTPLIVAAEENRGSVVAFLITLGADLEITERHGYTALTRAFYHGHDEIIAILLRSGAKCQEIDPAWKIECDKRKAAMGL